MFRKLRKSKVEREEVVADFVFFAVSFAITIIALYIFDIHWNFYPGGQLFPPEKYIFQNRAVYIYGGLIGAILGFFIIKVFLFGLKEEELAWKEQRHERGRGLRDKIST